MLILSMFFTTSVNFPYKSHDIPSYPQKLLKFEFSHLTASNHILSLDSISSIPFDNFLMLYCNHMSFN